jgi:hypothetical protein
MPRTRATGRTRRPSNAHAALPRLFADADQIDVAVYPKLMLIDCGANLTRITCPHCDAEIASEWWADRLDELAGGDWELADWELADVDAATPSPCCGAAAARGRQSRFARSATTGPSASPASPSTSGTRRRGANAQARPRPHSATPSESRCAGCGLTTEEARARTTRPPARRSARAVRLCDRAALPLRPSTFPS